MPEIDSLRFKAADLKGLAARVERLIREPELYARLSQETQGPCRTGTRAPSWCDLIARFLDGPWAKAVG